jgi:threonyl-tRNA synthetase
MSVDDAFIHFAQNYISLGFILITMSQIKITLPDGSVREVEKGSTVLDLAESIGEGLARAALAAKINGTTTDLTTTLDKDAEVQILTFKDPEGKDVFKHSASHVLAHAVKRVFPKTKLTIGPAVEDGFYYDFDVDEPFTKDDLKKIEKEMKKIVKEKIAFERLDVPKKEAKDLQKHEPYKLEMMDDLGDEKFSLYKNGEFVDLCKGPHVPHTGKIKAVKLTKLAGAYWRGDAKNKQLQRVYGVAFPNKDELKSYLKLLEEAEKRDHKKIGKEMDLYSFQDEGPGFPFIHPKGMVIWNQLLEFWREIHTEDGYVEIKTPAMLNRALWETSGHWENYRENMYTTKIDGQDFAIKPMNCPGGMLVYKNAVHSYRELPMKVGEIGHVHRHELSGVLSGLFRVRAFHQDDAHIFMTTEQIKDQIFGVIKLSEKIYSTFGLDFELELSTKPEKSVGTDEQWEKATKGLQDALDEYGKKYQINEGDGAFYGPKIDFHIKDALGRTWQCGTIQLDMSLPERFDLNYEGSDGKKHRPVMIHRVIYGSLERFFGIMVEHFAGKFPLWISPVQVRIITVADRFEKYAEEIRKTLVEKGIRAEIDARSESVSKKIREGQIAKINYLLVVGEQEQENKTINVRTRDNNVLGEKKVDEFAKDLVKEIEERRL